MLRSVDGDAQVIPTPPTEARLKPAARSIDYTAFAIFPGQARQERLVMNLAPGRTTVKRFRFNGATVLPGTKIRVGVKELEGSRILNEEVEIQ